MLGVAVPIRTLWAQALADAIDAGAAGGKLLIYGGTRPATGAAITDQTYLGMVRCADPCGAVEDGVLTFGALTEEADAAATTNATWFRATDSDDAFVTDGSIGAQGSGADLILNSVSVTEGGIIRINSGTLTAGNQ